MTITLIDPDKKFRGGADITPDGDSGKELGELIYDLQVAVNLVENGIVDGDFAGTALGRMVRTGAGAYAVIKDNLAATTAPAVGDDDADGYEVGSLWLNVTADTAYVCLDASTGAAVWREIDITATSVAAAGAVMDTDFNAQTILAAVTDDTPAPVTVAASTVVGRSATGDVGTLTMAALRAEQDLVQSYHASLPGQTDESEVSAALDGVATKQFIPTHIIVKVASASGAIAADGTLNVGTSSDGTEIASGLALTGLTTAGDVRQIPLAAATLSIAGNATLYANIESEDSTATTLVLDVYVMGRQF